MRRGFPATFLGTRILHANVFGVEDQFAETEKRCLTKGWSEPEKQVAHPKRLDFMKLFRDSLMALLILTGSASCASVTTARPKASLIGSGVFVSDSGQTIRADYRDNGTVTLIFTDGTTKVLSQAVSASGARYVSGSYE